MSGHYGNLPPGSHYMGGSTRSSVSWEGGTSGRAHYGSGRRDGLDPTYILTGPAPLPEDFLQYMFLFECFHAVFPVCVSLLQFPSVYRRVWASLEEGRGTSWFLPQSSMLLKPFLVEVMKSNLREGGRPKEMWNRRRKWRTRKLGRRRRRG